MPLNTKDDVGIINVYSGMNCKLNDISPVDSPPMCTVQAVRYAVYNMRNAYHRLPLQTMPSQEKKE